MTGVGAGAVGAGLVPVAGAVGLGLVGFDGAVGVVGLGAVGVVGVVVAGEETEGVAVEVGACVPQAANTTKSEQANRRKGDGVGSCIGFTVGKTLRYSSRNFLLRLCNARVHEV